MLVTVLINLQTIFQLNHKRLKLFDLLPILDFLGHQLPNKLLHIPLLKFVVHETDVFFIKFEESFNEFHKK